MNAGTHDSPMSRFASLLAHSLPYVFVAALVFRVATLFGLVSPQYDSVTTFVLICCTYMLFGHLRFGGLCLRCIRDSPLNPERAVRRNKFFLWMIHRPRRQNFIMMGALLVLMIAGDVWADGALNAASKLPMNAFFFIIVWANWSHHRLQPWCPYCRGWDEGGKPERVPDPDPAAEGER